MVSVQEARYIGLAATLAVVSPKPPWLNGGCSMASDVAGIRPASRSFSRARGNGCVVVFGKLACDVVGQHPELVYARGAGAVDDE